ncbi:MAG: hypothetical protein II367_00700 [Treponema sp.]|nr:hypothetical protein [Treponema sp.]
MNFKTSENLKSHAVCYYINSQLVTEDAFMFKRVVSILSGMKEGATVSWTEKSVRYVSFEIS